MGRNYKSRAEGWSGARRGSARGGTLIGLFIGLVFGVIFALGIAWYINRTPIPFLSAKTGKAADATVDHEKSAKPTTANPPAGQPAAGQPAGQPNGQTAGQPAALPGKPGDKPLEKPRFDFYKILPEGGSASPKPAAEKPARPANGEPAPKDKLYLQLGAFQNPADADNLKAKAALMGLEASVQKVESPEKGTMHRVRVGPYLAQDEADRVRAQLAQNGVSAALVRIKPKPKPAPIAEGGAKP